MTRLIFHNVEQQQPQHRDDTLIVLFGRKPGEDKSYRVNVDGFDPYFYAPREEVEADETFLLGQEAISRIDYDVSREPFNDDTELAKVYPPKPQDVYDARQHFSETWAADVPFTRRFRIDSGLKAWAEVPDFPEGETEITIHPRELTPVEPPFEDATPTPQGSETTVQNRIPRTVTFDIEVDDRGDGFPEMGQERILSIVAHDNYSDEVKGFIDLDGRSIEEAFPNGAPENVDSLDVRENETQMLIAFRAWFQGKDPDIVTGWNSSGFDIPFLIERMDELSGLNPNALSRLGWAGDSRDGYRIKGRTCYDLLTIYKENSFTELRSYSLDDVAEEELGAKKIHFDGSFFDLYENDPEKFIEYNARDTILTKDINEEAGVIKFRDALRREVGVSFEDSYNNKDFIDMLCRRILDERNLAGPTAPDYDEVEEGDFEGGFVFDAYEGVAENVVGIDLASLYPYTMANLNASPETKISAEKAKEVPSVRAENGQHFRTDVEGMFAALVDTAIDLKREYKTKRAQAETEAEYEKWDSKYKAAKTLTNSLYGVTGWELFFLYDEKVAEAVTLTGQRIIRETAEHIESTPHEVIYGDTDSTYIKYPDDWTPDECLDSAHDICDTLNNEVYIEAGREMGVDPENNLWEIEVEVHMASFFQAGKKKRYAYLPTWKDGHELDDPDPSITGFASERSDSSQLTVDTEEQLFDAILHGELDAVGTIIYEAAQKVKKQPTEEEWDYIGIPGGMNKKITDVRSKGEQDGYYAVSVDGEHTYPQDAHPRACYNSNAILNGQIDSASKPKRVYLKPTYREELGRQINVIAFEDGYDLGPVEDELTVDVPRMTSVTIINPFEKVLSAIGKDINAAVKGQEQTGLGAF